MTAEAPRPMLAFQGGACFVWAAVLAVVTHIWQIWIIGGVFVATGIGGFIWYTHRRRRAREGH